MRSFAFRSFIALAALLGGAQAVQATTIIPLPFDQVVRQAGVAVEGTVTNMEVRESVASSPPPTRVRISDSPAVPISVGVEGGKTLLTEVTFRVDRQIGGIHDPEIRFTLAGGSTGDETVVVFGMPEFEVGERYVLLLRPDFESTNVPVVGVSQGYFKIARDSATGKEMLLNANGDIVLGVEGSRVVVRHSSEHARTRTPRLGPAPVPESGSGVKSMTSPQVKRYRASTETPILPMAFLDIVQTMKEDLP